MRVDEVEEGLILPPLLKAAATASGFSISEIKSKSRHEPLPFVRYVLFAILHEDYKWSTVRIGRALNRDHASVCVGIKKYHSIIDENSYGYQVEKIINEDFNNLIMLPKKEQRIRVYMNNIRKIARGLPDGKRNAISNNLDRISLELKKDRPENRIKQRKCAVQ